MYNPVLGLSTTTTGSTLAAVLPSTGGFRPMFVAAIAVAAFGVITLVVSGISALKQHRIQA